MFRRRLALAVFVALAILAIDPNLFVIALSNRAAIGSVMARYPDRGWDAYPAFLEGVRAHTKAGDTIALVVPTSRWDGGYSYAYYRASYFLAGREVLPVVDRDDAPQPQNFARARYVAAWRRKVQPPIHVVWSGSGGALLGH
jgi:hypothetical protein